MPLQPVPISRPAFLAATREPVSTDVAVIGIPYTTPAGLEDARMPSADAPAAIRAQSLRYAAVLGHHDFEFGCDPFAVRGLDITDKGDVIGAPGRFAENTLEAEVAIRGIVERGAFPLVLGGAVNAAVPALRAFEPAGPVSVVHLGADLEWRHAVNGVLEGPRSTMRRVSELPWVGGAAHLGVRGVGATRPRELADADRFGAAIVPAAAIRANGVEAALHRCPTGPTVVVLDIGAMDPSTAPGVESPVFGGLSYFEASGILRGIAARSRVRGLVLTGVVPAKDVNGITSLLAARLALVLLGQMALEGQFDPTNTEIPATAPAIA